MIRLHHIWSIVLLALLILGMQHEGYVHAYKHLPVHLGQSSGPDLAAPGVDGICIECALLAGASNAVHSDAVVAKVVSPVFADIEAAFQSRAVELPSWFLSRAPPIAL